MKVHQLEKYDYRLACIKKKLPFEKNPDGTIKRHSWKKYKLLMTGKYNVKFGVVPIV